MTVVNYLKLSKDTGMGCADERETHGMSFTERTYDVSRKIFQIGDMPLFVGSSGSVSNSREIVDLVRNRIEKSFDYDRVSSVLKNVYREVRDRAFEEGALKRYNFTWQDFTAGRIPSEIMKELKSMLDDSRGFRVTLLLGGYDMPKEDFKIHEVVYPGTCILYEKFDAIGSGNDMADTVIGSALDSMKPDERNNIEKYKGARILMEATQAAWRNIGVGGRTQLVWTDKEQFSELGNNESNFLNNLLVLERKGYLKRAYADDVFKKIIHDNAKSAEFLKETREQIGEEFDKLVLIDNHLQ